MEHQNSKSGNCSVQHHSTVHHCQCHIPTKTEQNIETILMYYIQYEAKSLSDDVNLS
jgi:hypothetical protein